MTVLFWHGIWVLGLSFTTASSRKSSWRIPHRTTRLDSPRPSPTPTPHKRLPGIPDWRLELESMRKTQWLGRENDAFYTLRKCPNVNNKYADVFTKEWTSNSRHEMSSPFKSEWDGKTDQGQSDLCRQVCPGDVPCGMRFRGSTCLSRRKDVFHLIRNSVSQPFFIIASQGAFRGMFFLMFPH